MSELKTLMEKGGLSSCLSADAAEFVPSGVPSSKSSALKNDGIVNSIPEAWNIGARTSDRSQFVALVPGDSVIKSSVPRYPNPYAYSGVPLQPPPQIPPWRQRSSGPNMPPESFLPMGPRGPHGIMPQVPPQWIFPGSAPFILGNQTPFSPPAIFPLSQNFVSEPERPIVRKADIHQSKGTSRQPRADSPVYISRSAQTLWQHDKDIEKYTLEMKPHQLYKGTGAETDRKIAQMREDGDSDSGYNSPNHRANLISCGVQVKPSDFHQKMRASKSKQPNSGTVPSSRNRPGTTTPPPLHHHQQQTRHQRETGESKPIGESHNNQSMRPLSQQSCANVKHFINSVIPTYQPPPPRPDVHRPFSYANITRGCREKSASPSPRVLPHVFDYSQPPPPIPTNQGHLGAEYSQKIITSSQKSSSQNMETTVGTYNFIVNTDKENVDEADDSKKKKKRKRRGKKKKGDSLNEEYTSEGSQGMERAVSSSNVSESTLTLHFEDTEEFPDLTCSSRTAGEEFPERSTLSGTSMSYSDIIKTTRSRGESCTQSLTGSCLSGDNDDEDPHRNQDSLAGDSKKARKRRKRRELANKAAEAELAEISLEQEWLKEVGRKSSTNNFTFSGRPRPGVISDPATVKEAKKPPNKPGGKKSQQPIALDIAAMIDAIQKKPSPNVLSPNKFPAKPPQKVEKISANTPISLNALDSSAPTQKRGKEREIGKIKKPSPLKKVILKEREEKKRLRLLDEDATEVPGLDEVKDAPNLGIVEVESELSQDALSSKSGESEDEEVSGNPELSADLSPISQTSPFPMSPASPGNSGLNSPVTGSISRDPVLLKIHSRRFREYCTQILDKDIDECCTSLLQELVKFQDRMYHKDPVKAKTKRRVVLGLREVTKHLKLKKIKCVVISPNLEKIQSKGGLDEALNNILAMCNEQNVPFVFALGRRALGRACAKLVPVSVVGIFNYEGCENKYNNLISLTAEARQAYHEMVEAVEREVADYPSASASQASSIGGVPGLYPAHLGHSRTPSGCSAISFTSSILSEPISENYPHAEPEVDSMGNEIVRDAAGNVVHPQEGSNSKRGTCSGDIDDGNEADIEDFGESRRKKRGSKSNTVRFTGDSTTATAASSDTTLKAAPSSGLLRHDSNSTITESKPLAVELENQDAIVSHIDSIHTRSPYTFSQVVSGNMLHKAEEEDKIEEDDDDEKKDENASRQRVIDKERIKNWLESVPEPDQYNQRLDNSD